MVSNRGDADTLGAVIQPPLAAPPDRLKAACEVVGRLLARRRGFVII